MKRKILVVMLSVLLLTGCGATKEEKETMFYDSLEQAYISVYSTDGVGLPVYEAEKITLDNVDWYKVASSKYDNYEKIEDMISNVFDEKIGSELKSTLSKKYKEVDAVLYTTSTGGCLLDYQIDDTLVSNLKKNVKITKIKGSKVKFEYKKKKYTAKKDGNFYIFDSKVFECL